jgi:hypothetical protein
MPLTILFVLFAVVVAAALFAVIYRSRGIKPALIASALAFVVLIGLFVLGLNVMLSGM